jgi:hypothetical protein
VSTILYKNQEGMEQMSFVIDILCDSISTLLWFSDRYFNDRFFKIIFKELADFLKQVDDLYKYIFAKLTWFF